MIYNKQGLVTKAVDYSSGETSYYYYTFDGSLESEYRTSSDGSLTHYIVTDSNGNTVEKTSVNGQTKTITTGTDKDGKSFVSNDGVTNETSTDDFGRTTQVRTVRSDGKLVFNTDYEYANGKAENSTTNLVSKYSQSYGSDSVLSYDYSYDNNGNITEIKQNGKLTNKYVYDSLNELKEEYDYVNKFYINYSYDGAGNLQNKYEQVLDPTYGYPTGTQHGNTYEYTDTSWKDKLTKVNGSNISYDANGNPLSYRDGMSFEWENGRILKNINTSDKAIQMSYDSNGMRTQKTVDGVKTNYYYDSNKNLIALVKGNDTLLFYYDSDGSATSFSYNGTMYFYVKNLQGDVIRIIDLAGTEVASYVYDAWGNIKDTKGEPTIREINPIRYRGYVYDTETSLYYLQSRYYDPFTGRFLNADVVINGECLVGTNLYSYCYNNPLMYYDDGFLPKLSKSRISSDTIKIQISDKLKSIATYLTISAAIDAIGTAVCCFVPGAQVAVPVLTISGTLKTLCSYLLDKYGGNKKVYIYVKVKYGTKVQTYTYWKLWPYIKGKFTIKKLYIKKLTTGWGIC